MKPFGVNMPLKYHTPEEMTADLNIIKMMMIDEPELIDAIIPQLPTSLTESVSISSKVRHFS